MATIAELLLEQGRQRAEQRQRQGELSNQTWQSLANIAAQYGQNVRRDQHLAQQEAIEAPIRAQEAQMRGLQIQNAQGDIDARKAGQAQDAAFRQAMLAGDDDALAQVDPERASTYIRGRDALTAGKIKNYDDVQRALAHKTQALAVIPDADKPAAYQQAITELTQAGILKPGSVTPEFDPVAFQVMLAHANRIAPPTEKKTREIKVRNADGSETIRIVEDTPGFTTTSAADVKKYPITVPGPNGQPIQKLVTDAELAQGIPAFREAKSESTDVVQIMGPNGLPIWALKKDAVGKPAAQAPRAVTGQERGVLAFYNRAKDAVAVLTEGGDQSLEQKMSKLGIVGQQRLGYEGIGSNYIKSEDEQRYRNAQRSFTEARLRKESGAAIPESEFENDRKTYFVQPGDSADTVKQKATLRQGVIDGLKFASGKAYEEFYGEPNISPARAGGQAPVGPQPRVRKYNPSTGKLE